MFICEKLYSISTGFIFKQNINLSFQKGYSYTFCLFQSKVIVVHILNLLKLKQKYNRFRIHHSKHHPSLICLQKDNSHLVYSFPSSDHEVILNIIDD